MHHVRRLLLAATVTLMTLPAVAATDARGTKEEAKALCEAAVAHIKKVGFEQARKDFAVDKAKWMPKDIYPFVIDLSGVMQFHLSDKMIGKNILALTDASGKKFGAEMVTVAKDAGTGWVDYEWVHPVSKKIEDKTSYVKRVPGMDYLVGVGIYR